MGLVSGVLKAWRVEGPVVRYYLIPTIEFPSNSGVAFMDRFVLRGNNSIAEFPGFLKRPLLIIIGEDTFSWVCMPSSNIGLMIPGFSKILP